MTIKGGASKGLDMRKNKVLLLKEERDLGK